LIGGITLAGRRWGPGVAGWLSGFPVVAGPILFFVALEQGAQFASAAAAGALTGGIGWLSFALAYAWTALRAPWYLALAIGLAAYLVIGLGLVAIAPPFAVVVIIIVAAVVLGPRLFPRPVRADVVVRSSGFEIYARMLAGGLLTLIVTQLSPVLGPKFSGLLSVFPVMGIVLAAFSHRSSGGAFTIRLLRGMFSGFYAFTAFCLTLTLCLHTIGIVPAFLLALCFSLAAHLCVLWFMRRARQRESA